MSQQHPNRRRTTVPARRATLALTTVATMVSVVLLVGQFRLLTRSIALGVLGGVGLVAVARLGKRARGFGGAVFAGTLVAPVGLAISGGMLLGSLTLVQTTFPVERPELLSAGTLVVLGHVGIVFGCTVGAFGAALGLGGVALETLERTVVLSLASMAAPVALVGGGVVASELLGLDPDAAVGPLASGFSVLLALDGGGSLSSLLVLVALASVATSLALADTDARRPVWLLSGLVGLLALFSLTLVDVSVGGPAFGGTPVEAAAAHTPLRAGLFVVALWPAMATLAGLLGHLGLSRRRRCLVGATAGGAVTTLALAAVSDRAFAFARRETRSFVPVEIEQTVDEWLLSLASLGEVTLSLAVLLTAAALAVWLFLAVQLTVQFGTETPARVGAALAALGLFVAGGSAGTVEAPTWLVVGLVGTSLLVWDITRFDAKLVLEVGDGPIERVGVVHLGGTVAVTVVGAALALLVTARFPQASGGASSANLLALCSVTIGLVALLFALR